MKKTSFLTAALLVVLFSTKAQAQQATELMRQIHVLYDQRFDANGRYINNPQARDQFVVAQNAAITKIKAAGLATKSFKIYNNVMSNMVITVTLVQEKDGRFAGLLIERSQYDTPEVAALLRLYNLPILLGEMTAFSLNGASMVSLKGDGLSIAGGSVYIKYPTNYKSNTFDRARFDILKTTAGELNFFTSTNQWFSRVDLNVWTQIFAQNFGIDRVTFK